MKNFDYPVGTIFRFTYPNGDIDDLKITLRVSYDLYEMAHYFNDKLLDNNMLFGRLWVLEGREIISPKSGNFNSLYNKLNDGI